MLVQISGMHQGSIDVELLSIPRIGEKINLLYGADAQVKGEVLAVEHYIQQHTNEHKVIVTIRPFV